MKAVSKFQRAIRVIQAILLVVTVVALIVGMYANTVGNDGLTTPSLTIMTDAIVVAGILELIWRVLGRGSSSS